MKDDWTTNDVIHALITRNELIDILSQDQEHIMQDLEHISLDLECMDQKMECIDQ